MTSKNGAAKASLILILLLALGVGAWIGFLSGMDPAVVILVGLLNVLMVLAAFVLAIIGLVVAIRRPTKKRESVFALVVSTIFIVFLAVRMALSATTMVLDVPALETQIADWASQSGETFVVTCPPNASGAEGAVFTCTATSDSGTTTAIEVTMGTGTASWEMVE